MIVECSNCGAPLKATSGRRAVKCGYCGSTQPLRTSRTLMPQAPPNWRPPPQWLPPPQFPAPSTPLVFKVMTAWVKWEIISTVVTVVLVGVVGIGVALAESCDLGQHQRRSGSTPAPPRAHRHKKSTTTVIGSPICKQAAACCRVVSSSRSGCARLEQVGQPEACRTSLDSFRRAAKATGKRCP